MIPQAALLTRSQNLVQRVRESQRPRQGQGTRMSEKKRKRHTPEQMVAKLREADALLNGGSTVAAVIQDLGSLGSGHREDMLRPE